MNIVEAPAYSQYADRVRFASSASSESDPHVTPAAGDPTEYTINDSERIPGPWLSTCWSVENSRVSSADNDLSPE
jgi:hypothetical protein